jgi:hypothetical protein
MHSINVQTVYYVLASAALIWVVIKQLHSWWTGDRIYKNFVKELALVHIPHIQETLRKLCEKLDVEYGEAPNITFVDLAKRT